MYRSAVSLFGLFIEEDMCLFCVGAVLRLSLIVLLKKGMQVTPLNNTVMLYLVSDV